MKKNSRELERIYKSISEDLNKWDGEEPIEQFIANILKRRLQIDEEEAQQAAQEILIGILKYKKAREFIEQNPNLVRKLKKSQRIRKILEDLLSFFKRYLHYIKNLQERKE